MSIYIKDMEMPQEKKITLTIFPDGRVYKNYGERLYGRGEDCIPWRAIPVQPYGRLGDLDILSKEIKDMVKEFPPDSIGAERYRLFAELIKTTPTIIPAEEDEV